MSTNTQLAAQRAESERLEALAAERRAAREAAAAQDTNRTAGLDALRAATPQADAGVDAMLDAMPPEPPTLSIGAINERLGCCSVTGAQVADLGVAGVKAPRGPGLLFTEQQFAQIVRGLIAKLQVIS